MRAEPAPVATLALTFDDGPDERATPALLDLLHEAGARATFFPIAPRAARHPQLIARMLGEGHAVGVHCERHVRHSSRGIAWVRRDADCCLRVLRRLGARPRLWRTPWGDLAPFSERVARERGLALVGWDIDTHDWRGDDASAMFADVRRRLAPGAIVLAHDGIGPGARRASSHQTLRLAALVVAHCRAAGWSLRALS